MDNRLRPESKKHIVRCAHTVLVRDGVEAFSIRNVARECGCSASGIYRHFANKDELMLYASLISLDSYIKDLGEATKSEKSSISKYFDVEQLFARYSFSEPEIFYNMYFSEMDDRFDEIFLDCFSLFEESPEEYFKLQFGIRFISGGIYGRNLAMLEICHRDGFLTIAKEDLPLFNNVIVNMYRGFLDRAIAMKKRGMDISTIADSYLDAHRMLHQPILSSHNI